MGGCIDSFVLRLLLYVTEDRRGVLVPMRVSDKGFGHFVIMDDGVAVSAQDFQHHRRGGIFRLSIFQLSVGGRKRHLVDQSANLLKVLEISALGALQREVQFARHGILSGLGAGWDSLGVSQRDAHRSYRRYDARFRGDRFHPSHGPRRTTARVTAFSPGPPPLPFRIPICRTFPHSPPSARIRPELEMP